MEREFDIYEDKEPAIEDWQLATLEELDEQQQMETAAAMPKPMGRADSIVWVSTPCSCRDGDTRTCFLHGEVA